MKKIFLLFIVELLLISSVSAFDLLNSKESKDIKIGDSYTLGSKEIKYNEIWEKYKPIEITTWFGLGTTIFKTALVEHTDVCGNDIGCLSTLEIYLDKDGVLIDDLIWERSFDDGKSWVIWNGFTNWNIQIENKREELRQLSKYRDQLNDYCEALHSLIKGRNITPRQSLTNLIKIE